MKVLVAEDEPFIAEILSANLKHDGYVPVVVDTGTEVLPAIDLHQPDMLLLDIMLPGMDGYQICQSIRKHSQLPIIMITAKTQEADRLMGFDVGADDYVCKPFSPREVIARIKSLTRRSVHQDLQGQLPTSTPRVPEFSLNRQNLSVSYLSQPLCLTLSEFNLLDVFVSQPNRVFSRDQLLTLLAQQGTDCTDRAVDCHIKNLRKKLRAVRSGDPVIHTVYGMGYKMPYPLKVH